MADRERAAGVELASEVARLINVGEPLAAVCSAIAQRLRKLCDLQWGSVSLLDDRGEVLESTPLSPAVETQIERDGKCAVQESVMGWVVHAQEPLCLERVGAAPPFPEQAVLLAHGVACLAIVPVLFRDKIIGTLNLGSGTPGAIRSGDLALFELLAQLLALALGRARADAVRRKSASLALLSEVGRLAQSSLDLDRLLADVAALLRDHLRARFVAFSVLDPARESLVLRAASYGGGVVGTAPGKERTGAGSAVNVLIEGGADSAGTLVLPDPAHSYRAPAPGSSTAIVVALRSGERVHGIAEIGRDLEEAFTADDTKLVEAISDRIAGALDTAALFQEIEKSNRELAGARDELTILYEIGRTATSTLDLDRILGPVAKMICDSFGHDFVAVFLSAEGELVLRAWAVRDARGAPEAPAPGSIGPDTARVRAIAQEDATSLVREVARAEETLIVSNVTRSPRSQPLLAGSRSAVAIPLRVGRNVVGIMAVESLEENAFDLEDVRILETLADQLASAIDNARLYRELLAANEKQAQTFRELSSVKDDLMHATRLAALGEMSGRVAHEVLNPITGILARVQTDLRKMPSTERSGLALLGRILERWQDAFHKGTFIKTLEEEMQKKGGERYLTLMAEILTSTLAGQNELREDLAFVERHALRIVKIVDSLRGLARQSQTRERTSIIPILVESVELLRDACEKRSIELVERYPEALPDVEVDPSEMVQVFSNVLRNAMQAIDVKGEGSGRIMVDASYAEPNVRVRIGDTGTGIAAEHIPLLFEGDFTTKDRTMGTGLGLSLVRRFLRGYGGEIELESTEPGRGTTFCLTIPRAGDAPQGASAPSRN
ncbi:MAG: GAF domain-containing protein [Acidobacteriota bacterium]